MASSKRDDQLVRLADLRRFVGMFARAEDREATAEALVELARVSHDTGLADEARKRARQALALLEDQDASESNVRSLLQLAAACLDTDDPETATRASLLATERASGVDELAGPAALLAGVTSALRGDVDTARTYLDAARDRLVAANRPDGAALALTQLGLLDIGAARWDAAAVCFQFAREFYRAAGNHGGAADVGAIAARALAGVRRKSRDAWFREAAADAERAGNRLGVAQLLIELADLVATDGDPQRAAELAAEALPHLRMAFAQALAARDADAIASVLEVLVTGLLSKRFGDGGWQLLDRFRDELTRWGFHALAKSALEARRILTDPP